MAKIFISHSWEDATFTKKIIGYLEKNRIEMWIDYARIKPGDGLPDKISHALESCEIIVLIWSKSAANSYYVKLEWQAAVNLKKIIIPCLLDDAKIPAILCSFTYIDFTKDLDESYEQLLHSLEMIREKKLVKYQKDNPLANPFKHGCVIKPEEFIGRNHEVQLFFDRLRSDYSIVILGQPHIGKTSFLKHVLDTEACNSFLGETVKFNVFIYLDAETFDKTMTPARFWEMVLTKFANNLKNDSAGTNNPPPVYRIISKKKFDYESLEQLFEELKKSGIRMILVVDEFDVIPSCPNLHCNDFYGGLRSLASLSPTEFLIVIAFRSELKNLAEKIRSVNPASPFFNFFSFIHLSIFSENEMKILMNRAGDRFDEMDQNFIIEVSGRHPYLAQLTASKLWEAQGKGFKENEIYSTTKREVQKNSEIHFLDTWHLWSPSIRKAVIAFALVQIPSVLGHPELFTNDTLENLNDYYSEVEELKASGILGQNDKGNLRIVQEAFLWWIADELRSNIHLEADIKSWLMKQEISFLLSKEEEKKIDLAFKKVLLPYIEVPNAFDPTDFNSITECTNTISILFLAADPSNAARLRLGEEFREIQAELNSATYRSRLKLELPQLSLRPEDISRALLNIRPQIVHFSGHGTAIGALCFENQIGETHLVQTDALAELLKQFADNLLCVVLNTCFSRNHAKAIAKYIDYVIGMKKEISDKAAIAFSVGFYQAIGAGCDIEKAYQLGCKQIRLKGMMEHSTPVLINKKDK